MRRLILGLFILLSGCLMAPAHDVKAELGEEFGLKINQTAYIGSEDLLIEFSEVEQDSRCPSDVVCVWQGVAMVEVKGQGPKAVSFDIILSTDDREVDVNNSEGDTYVIELVDLEPYPESTKEIRDGDYLATLKVTRD